MHPSENGSLPFSGGMPFGWYAVYTKHRHEKSASQLLARKGFEVLLPLYRSHNRWSDRTQVVLLPLFPNYLFVECDLERRVQVLQTAGVCWFVSQAGIPSMVEEGEVQIVRRLVEAPGNAEPRTFLERGDRVRVLRGALGGLTGILTRVKNQYRVVISLGLLRKSAAVEIDLADLERIPGHERLRNSDSGQRGYAHSTSEFSYGK